MQRPRAKDPDRTISTPFNHLRKTITDYQAIVTWVNLQSYLASFAGVGSFSWFCLKVSRRSAAFLSNPGESLKAPNPLLQWLHNNHLTLLEPWQWSKSVGSGALHIAHWLFWASLIAAISSGESPAPPARFLARIFSALVGSFLAFLPKVLPFLYYALNYENSVA